MRGLSLYGRGILFMTLALGVILGTSVALSDETRATRVVTVGGDVTEIAYALGQQDRLVARDTTSTYPPEAEALPDVGYMRALSPEGVLSLTPDLIVAIEGAGPPDAIEVLDAAQVPFVTIPEGYTKEAIEQKIRAVGAALGEPDAAEALSADVGKALDQAIATAQQGASGKRVLFVISAQGGRIMASGTGTAADAIIAMAGGVNAVTGYEGYKPISDEAITSAAPDVILMMDRGGDHATATRDLFALPAIASTPAGRTKNLIQMDGLHLLGFGPRTASAVVALSEALDAAEGS
ncbi:heme/hemin ABC transporter substrate-binding protein [Tropicimonas marinistellae]|uniref:heme/hemin ABC transporter substrate-binding protein n=1 Tax=Tropicimonas marinistellae TaxID=1739787 RepID=UPI0008359AD6|nr:ABC transporter substrate-binding protein [Tropicimonas marinistellae]